MSLSSFVLLIRRCSYTFTGLTFMQGCLSLDQTVLFTVNGSRQALSFWEDCGVIKTFTFMHLAGALNLQVYLNRFLSIYSECDYDLKRVSSDMRVSK